MPSWPPLSGDWWRVHRVVTIVRSFNYSAKVQSCHTDRVAGELRGRSTGHNLLESEMCCHSAEVSMSLSRVSSCLCVACWNNSTDPGAFDSQWWVCCAHGWVYGCHYCFKYIQKYFVHKLVIFKLNVTDFIRVTLWHSESRECRWSFLILNAWNVNWNCSVFLMPGKNDLIVI